LQKIQEYTTPANGSIRPPPPTDGFLVYSKTTDTKSWRDGGAIFDDPDPNITVRFSSLVSGTSNLHSAGWKAAYWSSTFWNWLLAQNKGSTPPGNGAPVITTATPLTPVAGTVTTSPVTAIDPEGQTITMSFDAGTATFVTFASDGGSGLLTLAPTAANVGSYTVSITARDSLGVSSTKAVAIAVTAPPAAMGSALIDFGRQTSTTPGATNVSFNTATTLVDGAGASLGITLLPQGFNSTKYDDGTQNAAAALQLPATATRDTMIADPSALPHLTFSGLTVGRPYQLGFFASRLGAPTQFPTQYQVQGATTQTTSLVVNGNTALMPTVEVAPDAAGTIRVFITSLDGTQGLLGALRLTWGTAPPPPTSQPPVFGPLAPVQLAANQVLPVTLTATDPDVGDTVTFSLQTPSSFATIAGTTLTLAPTMADTGTTTLTVVATDSQGLSTPATLDVTVGVRVFVDLGSQYDQTLDAGTVWNNVTTNTTRTLVDVAGVATGLTLTTSGFLSSKITNGQAITSGAAAGIPPSAARDAMIGPATPAARVLLSGLTPGKTYTLRLFSSGPATAAVASSRYTVVGATSSWADLTANSNTSNVVAFSVQPSATGTLEILLGLGATNTSGSATLGVVMLEQ
ncbi:MAG: hypothetical protein JNG84_00050, partial [Archangium sp.]|nr:hypothetical protein [Archangium sp.]